MFFTQVGRTIDVMIIDIGCGHNPVGDVNVDLFVEATPHRSGDQSKCNDRRLIQKGYLILLWLTHAIYRLEVTPLTLFSVPIRLSM